MRTIRHTSTVTMNSSFHGIASSFSSLKRSSAPSIPPSSCLTGAGSEHERYLTDSSRNSSLDGCDQGAHSRRRPAAHRVEGGRGLGGRVLLVLFRCIGRTTQHCAFMGRRDYGKPRDVPQRPPVLVSSAYCDKLFERWILSKDTVAFRPWDLHQPYSSYTINDVKYGTELGYQYTDMAY